MYKGVQRTAVPAEVAGDFKCLSRVAAHEHKLFSKFSLCHLQLLNLDKVAMMFLVKSPNIFHHETWSAWFR